MICKDENGYEVVKTLEEVREFLKEKNDYWWGKEREDLDLKYYVPTDIICKALAEYEIGIDKNVYDYIEKVNKDRYFDIYTFREYLEEHGYEGLGGDNTYNHAGRPQNDINWETYKINDDRYWVVLMFHIGGDIRGNYTDEIILEFEYETQFLEVLSEISIENNLTFDFKVDNKVYELTPYILDECLEIYDREVDDYVYHIFGIDDEEVEEQIREQEEKLYNERVEQVAQYMVDENIMIMAEYDNFLNLDYYDLGTWKRLLNETVRKLEKDTDTVYKIDLEHYINDIIKKLEKEV